MHTKKIAIVHWIKEKTRKVMLKIFIEACYSQD